MYYVPADLRVATRSYSRVLESGVHVLVCVVLGSHTLPSYAGLDVYVEAAACCRFTTSYLPVGSCGMCNALNIVPVLGTGYCSNSPNL